MFGSPNITTNSRGVPYLRTTSVTVGSEAVDFSLGFRRVNPGYFTVSIANPIPDGTTETLPITLSIGGQTKNLTFFGGSSVTVADLAGTGVIEVFYGPLSGVVQLVSPLAPATT